MAIDLVAVLRLDDQITNSLKKVAIGAAAGFAAITAGAVASVNKFAEVDAQIRMAGAVAGATSSEFDALKQATIDLGSNSTKSMGEIAESFTEMAASGFEVNEAIAAMPGIIKASEASGESLALAAENVSAALNIWSLEASEAGNVADILTMSANVSAAGIVDLGQALKYAGAPAAALGMDLAEVSAAIGAMVDSGIDGSSAGTSLRAALLALNNPAKAQEKIMKSLGFSIRDASGDAKSLVDIVADMTRATEHMTAADRLATVGKFVGTEAASGFLALMSRGPEELQSMTDALRDSAGIAEETANKINKGLGALFKSIGSKKEALMFQVGEALDPFVSRLAETITNIDFAPVVANAETLGQSLAGIYDGIKANWQDIKSVLSFAKEAVIGLTVAFVAHKTILTGMAIYSTITQLITAYRAGTLLATAAQLGFNTALFANPIGLIVAGIAALIGIAVVLYRNFDTVKAKTIAVWDAIGGLKGGISMILGPIGFLINAGMDLAKNWDSTKSVWENVWSSIQRSAATSVNAVIGLINEMIVTINKIPGVNIPIVAKVDWGQATSPADFRKKDGSHYNGIGRIGWDGYIAELHAGERVLNRFEADQYDAIMGGEMQVAGVSDFKHESGGVSNTTINNTTTNNNGNNAAPTQGSPSISIAKLADSIVVREEADIRKIADQLVLGILEKRGVV